MLPIILDRKIARLEHARDIIYEAAMECYWEGPTWLLPKLESQIKELSNDLVRLEEMRK